MNGGDALLMVLIYYISSLKRDDATDQVEVEDVSNTEAPQSEPEDEAFECGDSDFGTKQELLPEDAFDMHEMEEALPVEGGQNWAIILDWRIGIDITWPDYVTGIIANTVVTLTTHGVINWIANRRVLSIFPSSYLLTILTSSTLNNLPTRRSAIEGELRLFTETLHELNQFQNITVNSPSTNNQGQQES